MRRALIVTMAVLVLPACGTTIPTTVVFPDGSTGYSVSCDGANKTVNDCVKSASGICRGRTFKIVKEESWIAGGDSFAPNTDTSGRLPFRTLSFRCGI
jgi:hypothetical protein